MADLQSQLLQRAQKFQTHLNSAHQIIPSLYLGSELVAHDLKTLQTLGVTHVLTIAPIPPPFPAHFQYSVHPINDVTSENVLAILNAALDFIDAALTPGNSPASSSADSKTCTAPPASATAAVAAPTASSAAASQTGGGVVFVHCSAGISRSGSVVVAYCMRRFKLTFEQALSMVQKQRSVVCPNSGFRAQLQLFHTLGWAADPKHPLYVQHFAPPPKPSSPPSATAAVVASSAPK
jgi:hypothetical protein